MNTLTCWRGTCLLVLLFLTAGCTTGLNHTSAAKPTLHEAEYDHDLAQRLGADAYGMRRYVLAFLKRGPNRGQDSTTVASIQQAHLENIERLAEDGKLVLAGPFLDDGPLRGIYIFDVETVEEAERLTATDPAIQAGRLVMELHPWYGSAATRQINALHKRITQ